MAITNGLPPHSDLFKDVDILVVDNDRDNRDLYALLLESYGAKVTSLGSIKDALDFLNASIPAVLICEMRFLGESVYPLIQKIRCLAHSCGRMIPIVGTSTAPLTNILQQSPLEIEAYLLKPVDLDHLVEQVWKQLLLSNVACLTGIQDYVAQVIVGTMVHSITGVN